jgi:hypothetical protein
MKKLMLASLPILAVVALVAAGCGGDTAASSKAAGASSPRRPVPRRGGRWQQLANRIHAPAASLSSDRAAAGPGTFVAGLS